SASRRYTTFSRDWSPDVCSSDLELRQADLLACREQQRQLERRTVGNAPKEAEPNIGRSARVGRSPAELPSELRGGACRPDVALRAEERRGGKVRGGRHRA